MPHSKLCSRCREALASTPGNAYCKPCRAEYQRTWRARRKGMAGEDRLVHDHAPRERLRATPNAADLARYRLI